jgi:hypothetical protein
MTAYPPEAYTEADRQAWAAEQRQEPEVTGSRGVTGDFSGHQHEKEHEMEAG